jgi:hypothetical protein
VLASDRYINLCCVLASLTHEKVAELTGQTATQATATTTTTTAAAAAEDAPEAAHRADVDYSVVLCEVA